MTTCEKLAQEAIQNFEKMTDKMSSLANGNGSRDWPDEEIIFPPLRHFLDKNRVLKKALAELKDENQTFVI